MTIAVDLGRKATKQTNKDQHYHQQQQNYIYLCADLENPVRGFMTMFLVINVFYRGAYGPHSKSNKTQGVQLLLEEGSPYYYF